MPEVIGHEKTFYLNAVIEESDFPEIIMKIGNRKVKGREIHGFFVTEEEFQKRVAEEYCSDGWYDVPLVKYEEPIVLGGIGGNSILPSRDFLERMQRGEFIATSEVNVKRTLKKLGVEIRRIKWYHKLGWPFKT